MRKCQRIKIVVFDVDGVLTCIDSVWRYLHINLGTWNIAKKHYLLFKNKMITYEQWAKYDVNLWKNTPLKRVEEILNKVPIRDGATELIDFLKTKNLMTFAISAGLDVLTDKVSRKLGIDYTFSNKLVVKNGFLTGDVIVNVDFYSKGKIIDEICEKFKVTRENIVVVGDSEVDIPMMRKSCFSIAFNSSSYKVVSISDIAIYSSSLRILYPIFKKLLST
ncbi:MAG: HAD-IB family phosphatase [Thermoproteales archaeon]|nr:HAD-IB family phosphatase [Thermoproteales archaeon]